VRRLQRVSRAKVSMTLSARTHFRWVSYAERTVVSAAQPAGQVAWVDAHGASPLGRGGALAVSWLLARGPASNSLTG
jgi:hypothetical protein